MILGGVHWRLFSLITLKLIMRTKILIKDERSPKFKKTLIGPGLIICNHMSIWDIPLYLLSFSCAPIMKKEVLKIPIFGLVGMANGAIPVDRANPNSRRIVVEMVRDRLQKGIPVQFYPESTRNRDWRLGPKSFEHIKITLFYLAYELKCPVIAVSLYGTPKMMDGPFKLNTGQKLGMKISQEILPTDFLTVEEFSKHCWEQVRLGYSELEKTLHPKD